MVFVTKKQYNVLLQPLIAEITEYRYIVLSCKDSTKDSKNKLMNYSYSIDVNTSLYKSNMYSKLIRCMASHLLTTIATRHLERLIWNAPNSQHGISIVADAPECNYAMLNVKRPGVLRQYYGRNIGDMEGNCIRRVLIEASQLLAVKAVILDD